MVSNFLALFRTLVSRSPWRLVAHRAVGEVDDESLQLVQSGSIASVAVFPSRSHPDRHAKRSEKGVNTPLSLEL